jgi:hypothetical protein
MRLRCGEHCPDEGQRLVPGLLLRLLSALLELLLHEARLEKPRLLLSLPLRGVLCRGRRMCGPWGQCACAVVDRRLLARLLRMVRCWLQLRLVRLPQFLPPLRRRRLHRLFLEWLLRMTGWTLQLRLLRLHQLLLLLLLRLLGLFLARFLRMARSLSHWRRPPVLLVLLVLVLLQLQPGNLFESGAPLLAIACFQFHLRNRSCRRRSSVERNGTPMPR